ncbi:MAG TPA: hypothetical protein PKI11_14010, partial [Candidatus Hydrogenedentes bacterium]|nr:hypothetical protein [Candidatus Hydrogenedentota bacterium]
RPRLLTLVVAQGMLVFFTGLILYAWTFHGLKDCGCMGEVRMGPGVSILKNLVMMACVAWSWLGYRHQQPAPETTGRIVDKWAAALAVAGVALGASYIELYKKSPATSEQTNETAAADETSAPRAPGPFSRYVIESEIGERFDLSRGTYLVALLSATCDHCMASVPTLNEYLLRPDVLPPLVGLCYEPSPGALEEFRILTGMAFPCYNLGNDFLTFVKFIGREPPRLSLVRDGTAVHSWDDEMPAADALIAWLERETGGAEPAAEAPPVFE